MPFTCRALAMAIVSIILPPLAVFVDRGCGSDLLINILLTILGYIPGVVHAIWLTVLNPYTR